MDKIYFSKPELNKKKLIITIIILFVLLLACTFISFNFYTQNTTRDIINNTTYLIDNNFNITFSNSYNLKEYKSADYFLLELHSENNLNFYIKKLENLDNHSLYLITKNDCLSFTNNFENVSEISSINYSTINNFDSCNYNFKYLDPSSNLEYYIQVHIIKIGNSIYSFTTDFPFDNSDIFNPIVNDIVNSIFINNN